MARWCLPLEKAVFLVQDWESNAFGSLLILGDNYNLTTNNLPQRHGAHRGRTETFQQSDLLQAANCDPCGTIGSSAGQPIDRGLLLLPRAALVATACGPGRPGLMRCYQGGRTRVHARGGPSVRAGVMLPVAFGWIGLSLRQDRRGMLGAEYSAYPEEHFHCERAHMGTRA